MRLRMRRRPDPCCPACAAPISTPHYVTCRLLLLGGGRRHPSPHVTARDTATLPCGCSDLLVRQHGAWGHRVDHSEPDYPRPPAFTIHERISFVCLGIIAAALAFMTVLLHSTDARPLGYAMLAVAAAIVSATLTLISARRPLAVWSGRKTYVNGEPGRYATCPACAGDGVTFEPAYPALPAPTARPNSR